MKKLPNQFILRARPSILFMIGAVIGLFFPYDAMASDAGRVAASFLQVNPSVREAALGGGQAAASGGISNLYSNPASLTSLAIPELWMSHNQSYLDTSQSHLAFGFPGRKNSFGFLAQYVNQAHEEKIGISDGEPVRGLGDFRYGSTLLGAAWARRLTPQLSLGVTSKGWNENVDGTSQIGWAADAGLLAQSILPRLDVGMAYKNAGPSIKGFDLPTTFHVGATYHVGLISLFSEMDFSSHQKETFRTGLELNQGSFWLRGGYENLTTGVGDSLGNFPIGGGLRIKGWQLDYAWVPKGKLGDQHRFGVTFGFGLTPQERERAARELDHIMAARIQQHAAERYKAGEAALQQGRYEEAKDQFSRALAWDPDYTEAHEAMKLAQQKYLFNQASQFYRQGRRYANEAQWLDAALHYEKALQLVPTLKEAQKNLAHAKRKINRRRSSGLFEKGVRHYVKGQYSAALKSWKALQQKEPRNQELLIYIEKAQKMKLDQELYDLKQEKKSNEQTIFELSKRAYTLYSLNQIEQAISLWERIMALDPNNADARTSLAKAHQKRSLMKGLDGEQNRTVSELNAMAMKAYSEGQLKQAAGLWRRALTHQPDNGRLKINLQQVEKELASR